MGYTEDTLQTPMFNPDPLYWGCKSALKFRHHGNGVYFIIKTFFFLTLGLRRQNNLANGYVLSNCVCGQLQATSQNGFKTDFHTEPI